MNDKHKLYVEFKIFIVSLFLFHPIPPHVPNTTWKNKKTPIYIKNFKVVNQWNKFNLFGINIYVFREWFKIFEKLRNKKLYDLIVFLKIKHGRMVIIITIIFYSLNCLNSAGNEYKFHLKTKKCCLKGVLNLCVQNYCVCMHCRFF